MDASTLIFLALAVAAWGSGAFFDKLSLKYAAPHAAFYLRTLFLILVSVPFLLWKYSPARQAVLGSHKLAYLFVLSSVLVTMAGVFFYLKAMSGGEASKIVPLSSTYPLVTFLLVYLFLGETITAAKFSGALLIAGGVYLISR